MLFEEVDSVAIMVIYQLTKLLNGKQVDLAQRYKQICETLYLLIITHVRGRFIVNRCIISKKVF